MNFKNKEKLFNKTTTGTLPREIAERLEANIVALATEYLLEGRLSMNSIEFIIGKKQPSIPDSLDTDTAALEERAEYVKLVIIIDNTVRERAVAAI